MLSFQRVVITTMLHCLPAARVSMSTSTGNQVTLPAPRALPNPNGADNLKVEIQCLACQWMVEIEQHTIGPDVSHIDPDNLPDLAPNCQA